MSGLRASSSASCDRDAPGFRWLGALGEALIREVAGVQGLEVLAAQDVRLDLARDIAARYAVQWYGECFDDLVKADGVDAVRNQELIANSQTTLRKDTLRAFVSALDSRRSPRLDTRVYALLDSAYGRTGSSG